MKLVKTFTTCFLFAIGFMFSNAKADLVVVTPSSPTVYTFNENTWVQTGSNPLTLSGHTLTGSQALTWNSDNLAYYAIVQTNTFTRRLVMVDPFTGVCTDIGLLESTSFSSLTYNSDLGIMYMMGGSGGSTYAEKLYSVNLTTAAVTFLAGPFSVGAFGEVIAYNYDDDMIYHWSGTAMEKINTSTFAATTITVSGTPYNEISGAVYRGGGLFSAADLVFNGATNAFTVTSAGLSTLIAPLPFRSRGFGYADPLLPVELTSFTSQVSGNDVTLNWSTSAESNNSGFDVERSANGTWEKIGFVSGNGNSALTNSYSFIDRQLATDNYSYRLKQMDFNGNFEYFTLSNLVVIGIPGKFMLSQNYPNPFNPATSISFEMPLAGNVNLSVFDINGKLVSNLVNEYKEAGYYSFNFNASGLSSGTYFYKMTSDNFTDIKKMTLIK